MRSGRILCGPCDMRLLIPASGRADIESVIRNSCAICTLVGFLVLLGGTGYLQAQVRSTTIPTLEKSHLLTYRFPLWRTSAFDGSVTVCGTPLAYRYEMRATETVIRSERESALNFTASAVFDCRIPVTGGEDAREEHEISETGLPAAGRDLTLELLTRSASITCDAAGASYHYRIDASGLTCANPALGETESWGWDDRYEQASTLREVVEQPGSIAIRNGAVLSRPDTAPVLRSIKADWLTAIVSTLLPPLPDVPIQPGVSWSAGSLVPASMFAEPPTMRFQVQWLSYDEEQDRARIVWKGETSGTALVPRSGIHHIGIDAIAALEVTGDIMLNLRSGMIESGRVHIESEIAHVRTSPVRARFMADITIKPEEPDTAASGEPNAESQPVIATAGGDEADEPGQGDID